MNKIIEVDFLPRKSEHEAFELGLTPTAFGVNDMRRILIVDNDKDSTHLVKVLLEKDWPLSGLRRKRRRQGSSERPEFSAGPDPA